MAERLMPTPELQSLQAFPFTGALSGAVSERLASLADGGMPASHRIAMAPPADPEETEEVVDEEDLDDEDDDLDDEDEDGEFEDADEEEEDDAEDEKEV